MAFCSSTERHGIKNMFIPFLWLQAVSRCWRSYFLTGLTGTQKASLEIDLWTIHLCRLVNSFGRSCLFMCVDTSLQQQHPYFSSVYSRNHKLQNFTGPTLAEHAIRQQSNISPRFLFSLFNGVQSMNRTEMCAHHLHKYSTVLTGKDSARKHRSQEKYRLLNVTQNDILGSLTEIAQGTFLAFKIIYFYRKVFLSIRSEAPPAWTTSCRSFSQSHAPSHAKMLHHGSSNNQCLKWGRIDHHAQILHYSIVVSPWRCSSILLVSTV